MSEIKEIATRMLKRFYGYDSFRPMQLDIIESVMSGNDTLVLMPTGGGKSVCYQIPALVSNRLTIVVSPLIALMKDQVDALLANGIPAAAVHSNQSEAENRVVMENVYNRRLKLLYISPERLTTEMERWGPGIDVALVAIDEAHCISQWGHDFRPEYTQLGQLRKRFPGATIMALTATANRTTRDDIVAQLNLRDPKVFISSFDRPNISLNVVSGASKSERVASVVGLAAKYPGDSGIVYCLSRKTTEDMAATLQKKGVDAYAYHAGLSAFERNAIQQKFINGDIQVVCATVAFGMGIDKSNIRWVVHNNLPQSLESYYQEIGRAGRDGLPSEALLFYSVSDLITIERFIEESGQQHLNREKLKSMREYAEASVCRRRILLSYFNETATTDCHNCDVCKNPPKRTDATVQCQMALSAIVRTGGRAGVSMLIDILRGSGKRDLVEKGYNRLKTFGVGRDLTSAQWNNYITQMLQLGMFEVHYADGGRFEVTDYGREVLFGRARVGLVPHEAKSFGKTAKASAATRRRAPREGQLLLTTVKEIRTSLSRRLGIPPDLLFNDRTLLDIAEKQPVDRATFSRIHGVSKRKADLYWLPFVNAVRQYKGMPALADSEERDRRLADDLRRYGSVAALSQASGIPTREIYTAFAEMIDDDRYDNFQLLISRREFMRIIELNNKNDEAAFRQAISAEFPDGLERIAFSMANFMLRHRG